MMMPWNDGGEGDWCMVVVSIIIVMVSVAAKGVKER